MIRKLDHIGIAVLSVEQALHFYESALGIKAESVEDLPEQKTKVAVLPIGRSRLELLESLEADSPVARFLRKRGQGLHHLCFQVEDIAAELERLRSSGVRLIDHVPRRGVGGCLVAFIHPESAAGVLIELSQPAAQNHNTTSQEQGKWKK